MTIQSGTKPNNYKIRKKENTYAYILLRDNVTETVNEEGDTLYNYEEYEIVIADRNNLENYIEKNLVTLLSKAKTKYLKNKKQQKYKEIEQERLKRTKIMPWTIPSSNTQVNVKIEENPPDKPRQTWLAGSSAWGIANVQKGNSDEIDDLIAADDSAHPMTAQEWVDFGIALKQYIKNHVMAAKQHWQDIGSYTTINEVINHDLTKYWP